MNIRLLCKKGMKQLREEGFQSVIGAVSKYLQPRRPDDFDLKHGTDTSGLLPVWTFTVTSPNALFGHRYDPTSAEDLITAIQFLHEDLSRFTFIDLGCGKGRPLLVASGFHFKQIVGVEFARELVEIARRNLDILGISNASVLHADVTDFSFPDGKLVIYMFNPFTEDVMLRIVEQLRHSLATTIYIIYTNPKCSDILDSSGFLKRLGSPPSGAYPQTIWISTR